MSLILEALRKMELERRSRRQGETDIRPEVLSYRGLPAKPSGVRISIPLAAVIILLIACTSGWFLFKRGKSAPETLPQTKSLSTVATPVQSQSVPPPTQPQAAITDPTVSKTPVPAATQHTPPAPVKEAAAGQATDSSAVSGITISGIAYQDERGMRRAVINGALVGEGAEVAGARVVEIKENRVRFSKDGQSFEMIYSSSLTNR